MLARLGFFFVVLSLFLPLAVSAANKPKNYFSDDVDIASLPSGEPVLLLPLNPNRLLKENELALIQSEIAEQLKEAGAVVVKAVISEEQDRFDYFLLTSEKASNMPEAFAAKADYVAAVANTKKLVIIPSVIEKAGKVSGQKMYLDGNKLAIRSDGRGANGQWSGEQRGLTLELEFYDQTGTWLMSTYGGIAMPRYADMKTKQFYRKDNIFEEKRDLGGMKKGVRITLKPAIKKLKFK